MAVKEIIYLTDNSLDPTIAKLCRRLLLREAQGIPIISVSQEPLDFPNNICLGKIGKCWTSLYKQLYAGLDKATAPYISIAEHDCLYTHEHLEWTPPRDDTFFYNYNCWLVQWGGNHPELNGMYSYWPKRTALSQLVCNRELLKSFVKERLDLLTTGASMDKEFFATGEFGVINKRTIHKAQRIANSGSSQHLESLLKKYLGKSKAGTFTTQLPNLDIRHGSNFTGPKRGKKRVYTIDYWGRFSKIMDEEKLWTG